MSSFYKQVTKGKLLGRGTYGQVYLLQDDVDKSKKYAIKIISNQIINKTNLHNEIQILKSCSHENIIKFIKYLQDDQNTYIITEYAPGGELFKHIVQRKYYDEYDARAIVKQILSALFYLSENHVLHGDLKPENCLLSSIPNDYNYSQKHYIPIVKLADFGTAKIFNNSDNNYTFGGTPGYIAPEVILHKNFTTQPDIYSLGVLTYVLISGSYPFGSADADVVLKRQVQNDWCFNQRFQNVSSACIDFINKCMTFDYTKRPSARQLLSHRWMQESTIQPVDLSKNKDELRKLMIKMKARCGFESVIITNVLKDMVEQIRQQYHVE